MSVVERRFDIVGSAYLSNTSSLVTKTLINTSVVLVGSANTRVGDADENLVRANLLGGGSLHDLARLGALVDGKGRHF